MFFSFSHQSYGFLVDFQYTAQNFRDTKIIFQYKVNTNKIIFVIYEKNQVLKVSIILLYYLN